MPLWSGLFRYVHAPGLRPHVPLRHSEDDDDDDAPGFHVLLDLSALWHLAC